MKACVVRQCRPAWFHRARVKKEGCPDAGFTLVELALVILIIGILAAITMPAIRSLTDDDIDLTVRRLIKTIGHLADQSATSKRIYRLNYDLDTQTYWVSVLVDEEFLPIQSVHLKRVVLPETVAFEDIVTTGQGKVIRGETHTDFYPVGRIDRTVFHLVDERDRQVTLFINPLTGRIKVFDGYREELRSAAS